MIERAIDILARTIYGEARNQDTLGMQMVAWVIYNRTKNKDNPRDFIDVCLKPYQFSCWNRNDTNFRMMMQADETSDVFKECQQIARDFITRRRNELGPDPTSGANHYCRYDVYPKWRYDELMTIQYKDHCFFRIVR